MMDGEIAGLTISNPPTQFEIQALRDKCEELADDVRALAVLVYALRGALVAVGVIKGGACGGALGVGEAPVVQANKEGQGSTI